MNERETEGWKEAAIAWSVCASIHETWAKGKDALYKTRHADFVRHADDARARALATPPSAPTAVEPDERAERDAFQTWANREGYDTAYTYDTERSRWVFFNPMTADLFKAWRASKGTPK